MAQDNRQFYDRRCCVPSVHFCQMTWKTGQVNEVYGKRLKHQDGRKPVGQIQNVIFSLLSSLVGDHTRRGNGEVWMRAWVWRKTEFAILRWSKCGILCLNNKRWQRLMSVVYNFIYKDDGSYVKKRSDKRILGFRVWNGFLVETRSWMHRPMCFWWFTTNHHNPF